MAHETETVPAPAAKAAGTRGRHAAAAFLSGLGSVLRAASFVAVALGVFLLLARGLGHFSDASKFAVWRGVLAARTRIEIPIVAAISKVAPTRYRGKDAGPVMALGLVYAVGLVLGTFGANATQWAQRLRGPQGVMDADAVMLGLGGNIDRTKLLEIYTQAKKTLEEQKRPLAFLSIDVVGSTAMKAGEDVGVAERDFRQYKHLVERCLSAHGALKSTWTPDGVMICFPTTPTAIAAGRDILLGLGDFNRSVKTMKLDFHVRIGVNAGVVFFDPALPLEEMSDRVIDVAGHMQKYGSVDSICAAKGVVEPHLAEFAFKPAAKTVDGFEVYEWTPAPASV